MKVSSTFSKVAGCRGGAPARAPQSAESSCAHKSAGGGPRGNPRRGFPLLFFAWCGCADTLGGGDGLSCNSTPFLWCLPKETVSSRQRKAPFYPGGSTIRVSAPASVDGGHLRPTWGGAGAGRGLGACAPLRWEGVVALPCHSTPFLLSCQKKRCRAAKEKRFFYLGGSTIRVSATASVIFTHLRPTWGGAGAGRGLGAGAPIRWVGAMACPAFRPHFFGACPKKRCRAAKEKRFFTLAAPPFA